MPKILLLSEICFGLMSEKYNYHIRLFSYQIQNIRKYFYPDSTIPKMEGKWIVLCIIMYHTNETIISVLRTLWQAEN